MKNAYPSKTSSSSGLFNSLLANYQKQLDKARAYATSQNSYSGYGGYGVSSPSVDMTQYMQPTSQRQAETISSITSNLPVKQDFSTILNWNDYYNPESANESALYRTQRYYQPIVERALKNLNAEYANRGVFRSGLRTQAQSDTAKDYAASEEEMRRQLINQAETEAREQYAEQQRLYEASPTSYVAPTTTPKISFGTAQTVPESYGTTYTDWINQLLKKY